MTDAFETRICATILEAADQDDIAAVRFFASQRRDYRSAKLEYAQPFILKAVDGIPANQKPLVRVCA